MIFAAARQLFSAGDPYLCPDKYHLLNSLGAIYLDSAIKRLLTHYPHHVGQIVYTGKMIRSDNWQSLSIPKGASGHFNHN